MLHDQPQPRIGGCTFGLSQQAGGGAFPCPRHGTQHIGQLFGGVLREFGVGFVLIGVQHVLQRVTGRVVRQIEHIGVQTGDVDGKGLNEAQVKRVGGWFAQLLR